MLPIEFFSTHTELSLPGRQGNSLGCLILFIQRLFAHIEIFQSKFKEWKYIRKEKRIFIHGGLEETGSNWRIGKN
jgi:hypothetical protein